MTNFVPIRSAAYIYKVFGKKLPIYDNIFEKSHNNSQGKNFTSIFLPLNDFGGKNPLAHQLLWSQKTQEGFA